MDKSKDFNRRLSSDSKKVGSSKVVSKNNSNFSNKSGVLKKNSYISRPKSISTPFEKKYDLYANESKTVLKQNCDKCIVGTNPNLLVNSVKPSSQLAKIESGHDLNGNLSFNPSAFCNFPTLTERPNFSLSYQAAQQCYELSVPKPVKRKPRTTFHDKRTFNSKVSKTAYHANKFLSPTAHSSIRYQTTKTNSTMANTVPFITIPANRICGDAAIITDQFSQKCYIKPNEVMTEQYSDIKVTNFPVYAPPNKACFTVQVDPESQLRGMKKSDFFIQQFPHISVTSIFDNALDLRNTDAIIFPSSQIQKEHVKPVSNYPSNILPEVSKESTSLKNVHSVTENMAFTDSSKISVSPVIPQASYADVIRMSTLSHSNTSVELGKAEHAGLTMQSDTKDDSMQSDSLDWMTSRLSQLNLKHQDTQSLNLAYCTKNIQNSVKPHSIVVNLEKPSFYNSSLQNNKSTSSSTPLSETFEKNNSFSCEENGDKMSSSSSTYSLSIPSDTLTNVVDGHVISSKPDSIYSSEGSIDSSINAFKPIQKKVLDKSFQNKKSPVIIMNNCSPAEETPGITFGIDYEEIIKLCSENYENMLENISSVSQENTKPISSEINEPDCTGLKSPEVKSLPDENSMLGQKLDKSLVKDKLVFKNKELIWKAVDVDYSRNNHIELANYLHSLWEDAKKDPDLSKGNIKIYKEA